MSKPADPSERLEVQYADAQNVSARAGLHYRFSTNPYGWPRWVFDQLDLPPRCRILELGCGPAWLWLRNLDRVPAGWEVTLSDFSPGMLSDAREALVRADRPFSFEVIDAQSIPFDAACFDAVIANHMLYHAGDVAAALAEIRRVLAPGGRLYAATNGLDHMRELRELARTLAPETPLARGGGSAERFGLANGAEQLEAFFADVELHRYEDALSVPQVQPLVDYVLSTRGGREAFVGPKLQRLRRQIADRITTAGAFHITKSVGLFTATRPAGPA